MIRSVNLRYGLKTGEHMALQLFKLDAVRKLVPWYLWKSLAAERSVCIGMWCVYEKEAMWNNCNDLQKLFFEHVCRIGSWSIDFAVKQRFRHRFERNLKQIIDPQRIKISYLKIR